MSDTKKSIGAEIDLSESDVSVDSGNIPTDTELTFLTVSRDLDATIVGLRSITETTIKEAAQSTLDSITNVFSTITNQVTASNDHLTEKQAALALDNSNGDIQSHNSEPEAEEGADHSTSERSQKSDLEFKSDEWQKFADVIKDSADSADSRNALVNAFEENIYDIMESPLRSSIMLRHSVIYLIASAVDQCIYKCVKLAVLKNPSLAPKLPSKNKSGLVGLTLEDLESCDKNFAHAKELLVSKHMEALLTKSLKDQMSAIRTAFGISVPISDSDFENLNEVLQRRHVLIHGDGNANHLYLNRVQWDKVTSVDQPKLQDSLDPTKDYLKAAIDECWYFCTVLVDRFWAKFENEDPFRCNKLSETQLNMLRQERLEVCEKLCKISSKLDLDSDYIKKCITINYCLCIDYSESPARVLKILDEHDWSSCNLTLKIAVSLVKREFDFAFDNLPLVLGTDDGVSVSDLMSWPLFNELRTHDKFESFFSTHVVPKTTPGSRYSSP